MTRKIAFVRPAFETTTRRVTKMYDEWTTTKLLIKAIEFILWHEINGIKARAFPWKVFNLGIHWVQEQKISIEAVLQSCVGNDIRYNCIRTRITRIDFSLRYRIYLSWNWSAGIINHRSENWSNVINRATSNHWIVNTYEPVLIAYSWPSIFQRSWNDRPSDIGRTINLSNKIQ